MLVETEEAYKELSGFCDNPDCFYCGKPVSLPMIVWSGTTAYIQFHLDCAATFQLAFTRDLHVFKQSTGKVLIFDASPEESQKALEAYIAETERDHNRIPQYNIQLTVPDFHFIDGGSEKVHIQKGNQTQTRCSHYFKQIRVMQERELDSSDVCHHCTKQGGYKIYPTGKFRRYVESSGEWRVVIEEK